MSPRWRRLWNHERENVVSCFSSHSLVEARKRGTVWMHCVRQWSGLCSLCWLSIRTSDADIGARHLEVLAAPSAGRQGSISKTTAASFNLQARSYKRCSDLANGLLRHVQQLHSLLCSSLRRWTRAEGPPARYSSHDPSSAGGMLKQDDAVKYAAGRPCGYVEPLCKGAANRLWNEPARRVQ